MFEQGERREVRPGLCTRADSKLSTQTYKSEFRTSPGAHHHNDRLQATFNVRNVCLCENIPLVWQLGKYNTYVHGSQAAER
jgi:hypothetical protein